MASRMGQASNATIIDGHGIERRTRPAAWHHAGFRMPLDGQRASSLTSLIEAEIIPRLMVAHAPPPLPIPAADGPQFIHEDDIERLAPLALQVEADVLLAHVEAILARGIHFETLLVDLIAPTARMLGEYWKDDRCDFVDVTMGLWRLQEVVREISDRLPPRHAGGGERDRALFASMPGDQHSFGTVVVEEMFRRNGWATDRLTEASTSDLLKAAADGWFDIVGLTVSCDCHIGPLSSIIAALRNVSKNPRVCVMVGGRIFSADPDLAVRVGADGTASDADLALGVARTLVQSREEYVR